MEIVKQRSGDVLEVRVSGRLDNHWSTPFDEAIEEMIREGEHHFRVDLTDVTYLSSAGIGALMKAYSDTTSLQGSFIISAASDRVRTVLKMVALESLLFGEEDAPKAVKSADAPRQMHSEHAVVECHALHGTRCEWQFVGDPSKLQSGFTDATRIVAEPDLFALGVGALGPSYDECRGLFGEFLAAAGTAAFMPTDGTSTPDYMTRSGDLVAEIQALYAIVFRGSPSYLLRFDAATPGGGVPLSEIVSFCAEVAGTPRVGIVMAAEVLGLICTLLRKSPDEPARLDYPAVRDWLSYLPEHEHTRSSSIVVGVASTTASPFLRPVSGPAESRPLHGHFHTAVTAFRSLPRGRVEMADILAQAIQPRSVVSVVHLLRDDRPIEGGGESEFLRGACWVFPIEEEAL